MTSTGTSTPVFTNLLLDNIPEAKVRYHGKGKQVVTYDKREFIAWDGEGWTDHSADPDCPANNGGGCAGLHCPHYYCLFGNSRQPELAIRAESLATRACLQSMLSAARAYPHAIHIGFAFSYDVNMILRDLPRENMVELREKTVTEWKGYRIEHIPKKWFSVSGKYCGKKVSIRIQDIFSFFACSFVKALKGWNVGTASEIEEISSGKDSRNSFKLSDLDSHIVPYWTKELALLVDLANQLRQILYSANLKITGWYGPGNIATFLYKKHGTAEQMDQQLARPIITAAQYAYAGGRFEGFKAGYHDGPVYSADINSAYPYALSQMPNLRTGHWRHIPAGDVADFLLSTRVGLYKVEYRFNRTVVEKARREGFPLPLFHRRQTGHVWYPEASSGWYHAPEFKILMDMWEGSQGRLFAKFEIYEAWIYEDDGTSPFAWVSEMYDQRLEWKRQGNPAQLALKLGINSLYGKLAQRIGSKDGKAPQWHQLEWAGAITATCRSMLYDVALENWETLIGVETDGIYCTQPIRGLEGSTGDTLGAWGLEDYSGMLFIQNGVYWLRDSNGNWKPPKTRGIPQSHMDIGAAMSALRSGEDLVASQQYFIGYGTALHHGKSRGTMPRWNTWTTGTKAFEFGGNGKRYHSPERCVQCIEGRGFDDGLHTLSLRLPVLAIDSIQSAKHRLPWFEDLTQMSEDMDLQRRWDIIEA
jgi:hypothetical protein